MKYFHCSTWWLFLFLSGSLGFSQTSSVPSSSDVIPSAERHALIELFHATDGSHWRNNKGWLGPDGTECDWYGVSCAPDGKALHVDSLELSENNLRGRMPDAITELTNLEWLSVFGNHLSDHLPKTVVDRWLSGKLHIAVESTILTDVSEINYEWSSPSILCARRRIILRSDNTAIAYTESCRNADRNDRQTFCQVRKGAVQDFAKLAWALERNGFYKLQSKYERNMTHGTFATIRVVRDGKTYEVKDYGRAGPIELWELERAVEAVGELADWTSTTTQKSCPKFVIKPKLTSQHFETLGAVADAVAD